MKEKFTHISPENIYDQENHLSYLVTSNLFDHFLRALWFLYLILSFLSKWSLAELETDLFKCEHYLRKRKMFLTDIQNSITYSLVKYFSLICLTHQSITSQQNSYVKCDFASLGIKTIMIYLNFPYLRHLMQVTSLYNIRKLPFTNEFLL